MENVSIAKQSHRLLANNPESKDTGFLARSFVKHMGTYIITVKEFLKNTETAKTKSIEESLAKLQKNLTYMSKEQKIQYARQLRALKTRIATETRDIILEYTLGGYLFFDNDTKDRNLFIKKCNQIIDEEAMRKTFENWSRTLFSKQSLSDTLKATIPFRNRILNEAYKPYWEKYCIRQENGTWYNKILRAEWDTTAGAWKNINGRDIKNVLPPPL